MTPRRRLRAALPLLALALALAGCSAGVMPAIEGDANALVTARRLIERRDFFAATELLKGYVDRNAGSESVDEAIYLLGEAQLKAREYAMAQIEFERLLRDYPESDSSAAASFALAECLRGQSRMEDFDQEFTVRALEQYERYLRDHPDHWRAAEAARQVAAARARLARKFLNSGTLYLKIEQPEAARVYFERVRTEFPDTPLLGDALIGLARCDARSGKRDEAIAALKRIEAEFAGQPFAARAAEARMRIEKGKDAPPRRARRGTKLPETP